MDYRNILAFAGLIAASGYFVQSLQSANAYPQGANISLGSNPIESVYENRGSGSGTQAVFSNTSGQDFVITNLSVPDNNHCRWILNGVTLNYGVGSTSHSTTVSLNYPVNIVIHDGETLSLNKIYPNHACMLYMSGYYVHP